MFFCEECVKGTSNICWKWEEEKGSFYAWWMCKKIRELWTRIHTVIHRLLKVNMPLKPEFLLRRTMDKVLEKCHGTLFLNVITATRLFYT